MCFYQHSLNDELPHHITGTCGPSYLHSFFALLPVLKNQADRTSSHSSGTQKLIAE